MHACSLKLLLVLEIRTGKEQVTQTRSDAGTDMRVRFYSLSYSDIWWSFTSEKSLPPVTKHMHHQNTSLGLKANTTKGSINVNKIMKKLIRTSLCIFLILIN